MRVKFDRDLSGVWLGAGALALFGAAMAAFDLFRGASSGETARVVALCALAVPALAALIFVEVAIHEWGHYLAARIVGFRVTQFHVLNLRLCFSDEDEPDDWLMGSVGVETTAAQDRPLPWAVVLLAGPAFSLMVALAALLLYRRVGEPWNLIVGALGILATFSAYRTLWPSAGDRNDMGLLLDALRPDSENLLSRADLRVRRVVADPFGAELDPRDVERCVRSSYTACRIDARQAACYRAIALGSPESVPAARAYLEALDAAAAEENEAEEFEPEEYEHEDFEPEEFGPEESAEEPGAEETGPTMREWIERLREDAALEHAFAAALFASDPAPGRALDERLTVLNARFWTTARRMDAALALAEGDLDGARLRTAHARSMVESQETTASGRETENRFLALVEARIRSSASA